ncbi:hypothetical protein [Cupriavidus pauculus]|uniref:hypothetical protein n=1 Tax=Cupriavidus pauculus TaxID=82633 RepID=UPI003857B2C2
MSIADEFAVIDMIAQSELPTSAVDAFSLSVIKMERQLRRLFTYLVFQSDAFDASHVEGLRGVLNANDRVYFWGFERGIGVLHQSSVRQMLGATYDDLEPSIREAIAARNKIFHGQLTNRCLQREDLTAFVGSIRSWCERLADTARLELGYDGFARHSFRKGPREIVARFRVEVNSLENYREFLARHVQRQPQAAQHLR